MADDVDAEPVEGFELTLVQRAACTHCARTIERTVAVEDGEVVPAGEWYHEATFLERC